MGAETSKAKDSNEQIRNERQRRGYVEYATETVVEHRYSQLAASRANHHDGNFSMNNVSHGSNSLYPNINDEFPRNQRSSHDVQSFGNNGNTGINSSATQAYSPTSARVGTALPTGSRTATQGVITRTPTGVGTITPGVITRTPSVGTVAQGVITRTPTGLLGTGTPTGVGNQTPTGVGNRTGTPSVITRTPRVVAAEASIPLAASSSIDNLRRPLHSTDIFVRETPSAPPANEVLPTQNQKVFKRTQFKNSRKNYENSLQMNNDVRQRPGQQAAFKQQRNRSNTPNRERNRDKNVIVKCSTCQGNFGTEIYQCKNGHSSCHRCKGNRTCGRCHSPIENMRNFALEDHVTELRVPCENNGCCLHLKLAEMEGHLKECPFGDMCCPVNNVVHDACSWKGKVPQIGSHLKENHPEVSHAAVNAEMKISNILDDSKNIMYVDLGYFKFIVHVQVSVMTRNVYMAVQLLGSTMSAAKWTYELHVYNKKEPRRKFTFSEKCHGITPPMEDVVRKHDCAVLALPLAATYMNEGEISYKFYIKKTFDAPESQCGGGARRKQPL